MLKNLQNCHWMSAKLLDLVTDNFMNGIYLPVYTSLSPFPSIFPTLFGGLFSTKLGTEASWIGHVISHDIIIEEIYGLDKGDKS